VKPYHHLRPAPSPDDPPRPWEMERAARERFVADAPDTDDPVLDEMLVAYRERVQHIRRRET